MGQHRLQGAPFRTVAVTGPGGRRRRRRPLRTAAFLVASLGATLGALLLGSGLVPLDEHPAAADTPHADPRPAVTSTVPVAPDPDPSPARAAAKPADPAALPSGTGSGKRIVFSESAQRVWLVGGRDQVVSTYLVSGSVIDNLHPGTYDVYSRSRWAVGVDDAGTMQYFVRFTKGPEGAAIGFHTIPRKNGDPLQSESQLGTPQSHGCIRQRTEDAIRLWDFAPEGTTVVVV